MVNIYDNPWAGLSAYQDPENCKSPLLFCGRDNDSYDVAQLIDDNILITIYGKSGVGKTSLLNAGVFPRLRSRSYLPISIRLGMEAMDISFQDCLISKLITSVEEKNIRFVSYDVTSLPSDQQSQEYLWSYFARTHLIDTEGNSVFPVFVLDQFEEVFKQRKKDAEALLRQLNYLMDETHSLSDRVIDGQRYTYDFNFRFVLSIREDDLYSLEDSIDDNYLVEMKRCRYRLRSLTEDGARDAILLPGTGLFDELEKEQIANAIIQTARNKEDGSISTNVLSLICSRLFIESEKSGLHTISAQLVNSYLADNPFEKYYHEATAGLSNKERAYIESNLIDSTGRRNSISETEFFLNIKNGAILLEGPQKILQRISVSSDSKDNRIELIHDSFCTPLLALKQKRLLRRRLRLLFVSLCVTAISVGVAAFIYYQKRQVDALNLSMLENNSRFVSEKSCMLTEEGDSYTARLLALAVLPPNRPYVIEAEAALRKAYYHNTAVLRGHSGSVCSVSFSEDGQQIISTSVDSTKNVWDANNGRLMTSTKCSSLLHGIDTDISVDGKLKAVINNITDIIIYDVKTGRVVSVLKGHSGKVNMICFSPDSKELASASDDNTVRIWDVYASDEIHLFKGHTNNVKCLAYSPDGRRLLSGSDDCTVRIWDVYSNNAERIPFEQAEGVLWSCFSPDGKYVAAVSFMDNIIVWRTADGKIIHLFQAKKNMKKLAFHPTDNNILVTADSTLCFWNLDTGLQLHTPLTGHHKFVKSIAFSRDGQCLVSGSLDGTVIIWDVKNYKPIRTLSGFNGEINDVAFNPVDNSIATATGDGTIKIWDIQTGECIHTINTHHGGVTNVAFSPSGTLLASTLTDNTVMIWKVGLEKPVRKLEGNSGTTISVSFYSDETLITSSSTDALVKVWDISSGIMLCNLSGRNKDIEILRNVCVLPQSPIIYSLYDQRTNLICKKWNYPTFQELIDSTNIRFEGMALTPSNCKQYYLDSFMTK